MAGQPTPAHPATMEAQLQASNRPENTPIPQPIAITSRLIIRPMRIEDAPSTALNANDPLVTKYMSLAFGYPYTLAHAKTWINMNITAPHQNNFVICERSSPETVIGGCGLKPGADVSAHTAEVGFWVGQAYWGRGYTTEMLEAFTKWTFESWENDGQRIRRVLGCVFSGNVASMRCFDKCGYAREGVMKDHVEKHGEMMDMHIFGMTKPVWEKRMNKAFNNH
ncbi:GCN5-related N-acetyltransferas-like protein [Clathrospora elynae]|uniref:GCN5-related N-acetyltransferas-like protein n=1 Tax=Clathrospora elynae TaxID=706981 RepID=A0A6A5S5Y4_9PLEO|nr:GCN5-related N-acetyltransferas-like protein [Clathrospora elynae]